ncbi:MAG TPA: hypothetical protein VM223_18775 [Planctomycetota bacterium]|nr:hypothetical protein [Planctomycetota bacterium]
MLSRVIKAGMVAAVMFVAGFAAAEKTSTIRGTVSTSKTATGEKTGTLMSSDGTLYTIVMDDRGEKMAKKMEGKKVQVVGVVSKEGEGNLLRVLSYDPVLTGTVQATIDQTGAITGVQIVTRDGVYDVTLDQKGLEMGKTMDGYTVDAVGTITQKKMLFVGRNRFTVKSFERHKEGS